MATLTFVLGTVAAVVVGAVTLVHALIFALRPLLIRFLPDDFFGPDGIYIDTRRGLGIFDLAWFRPRRPH